MKKIVGTIAAIALAASSAFAGANFGMGFNRGFFTPFAWDGEAKADISTSWGEAPRIGASFSAASEDVGLADPQALVIATSAMQAVHMVGMPEARILLSEAAVYVATSKKSNAAYLGIDKALADVANKDTGTIPMHIRNAPAEGMSKEGYGVGYKYPHDYPNHWVEQQYLPDKMLGTKYYIM